MWLQNFCSPPTSLLTASGNQHQNGGTSFSVGYLEAPMLPLVLFCPWVLLKVLSDDGFHVLIITVYQLNGVL